MWPRVSYLHELFYNANNAQFLAVAFSTAAPIPCQRKLFL